MKLIEKEELNQLISFSSDPSISILISTHIAGKDVLEENDRTKLKGKWDECKRELEKKDISKDKIEKIEKPIQKLIEDSEFWRHQSNGLAIFAAEDFFKVFSLPIRFEDHTYISTDFYVRSLAPALSVDQKFFVLALQLKEVKLYEATEYSLAELIIKKLVPDNINEEVGYDYEEKHLQMRSQQEGDGNALFHGHGGGERDEKEEIYNFFNAVDKGITQVLKEEKAPLLIYCQDYLFPIYQKANSYQTLYEKPVKGNPNDVGTMGLHEKAVQTIQPYLEKEKQSKIEKYKEVAPELKNDLIRDILPFAFEGKVDALFIENREEVWGLFNESTQSVEVHDEKKENSVSLMNLAAKKVLENNGSVYLIDSAFMPSKNSKINALLRYS
jgi:hypothetical protein